MTPVLPMQRSGTVVDARVSLAMWLRGGRSQKKMSLEDVARITKIQLRILERLEAGTIKPGDGMPAEVFVRGFVRSIARCVGLDETEALRRYTEAAAQASLDLSPVTAGPAARAFVESMSELAPHAARTSPRMLDSAPDFAAGSLQALPLATEPVIAAELAPTIAAELAPTIAAALDSTIAALEPTIAALEPVIGIVVEATPATDGKRKKPRKATTGKGRGKRRDMATGTPFEPTPVVVAEPIQAIEIATATAVDPRESAASAPLEAVVGSTEVAVIDEIPVQILEPGQTWSPRMPVAVTPTVPWRINASAQLLARTKTSTGRIVPSLVIDDSDPDLAEREVEDRAASKERTAGRSFLPPILRDREDRSARQGGLTLAVIILLIAATLTLSYLMRRPSSSGDGVTQADPVESVDQLA